MKPRLNKDYRLPASEEEMTFGTACATGLLTAVNSGWRTFRPVIDSMKCVHCLICWVCCPDGAIDREGRELSVDYDYCKGCGICAHECPRQAISMVKEGK
ncbi:MAG: 4Fe-4S binding protein [Synergistaceae bacterium]|jgi:pyruvate ferredoxin oxidoreductase delta subunit|nr:4Fe-4S binding protein [Synergistaceae bacterium]